MKNRIKIWVVVGIGFFVAALRSYAVDRPDWIKDLIIYEISTKNFTSPKGPGTGTFRSTAEKADYLADLGITGIWLSGHNLASDHFYGIWTQYACIRPDRIDPSLGTRDDLKAMVDTFHKKGIRVFLDVITHGVVKDSPLIKEHPEWFKGGSWGMTDYDWAGGHKDLDEWWVKTHVDYVLKQGIDGYRLDVNIYRPDLWNEIKRRCAEGGHPITVFLEAWKKNDGACDFFQHTIMISASTRGVKTKSEIVTNAGQLFERYAVKAKKSGSAYTSVQLSCHDDGWGNFPPQKNPYVAEGSRCLFGYSFLFTPAIPLFMSGEEFDATFNANPKLVPGLYGKGKPGTGKWLYGAVLDWSQLKQDKHKEMLADVKKMIRIRKEQKEFFEPMGMGKAVDVFPLAVQCDEKIPIPFAIKTANAIMVVAGNNTDKKVSCTISIPLKRTGMNPEKPYTVVDLWSGEKRTLRGEELQHIPLAIERDRVRGGGLALLKIGLAE